MMWNEPKQSSVFNNLLKGGGEEQQAIRKETRKIEEFL